MPIEALHDKEFLERVKRSTIYFADQLHEILAKPIEHSAKVESNNKQATRRLSNTLPDLRQTSLARQYLLRRLSDQDFNVSTYLHEKQMSMLDAFPEKPTRKPKRPRKPKSPK